MSDTPRCECGHLLSDHQGSACKGPGAVHDDGRVSYCPCGGFRSVKGHGRVGNMAEPDGTKQRRDEFDAMMRQMMIEGAPLSLLQNILEKAPNDEAIRAEVQRRTRIAELQSKPGTIEAPEISVERDYDGYFERLVISWVAEQRRRGLLARHKKIIIDANPYASCAVSARSDGVETLQLEFYSAVRTGFGRLTDADRDSLITKWL